MNTTLLFVELVITGIQSSLWIFLLLLNILGYSWIQKLPSTSISGWETAIILVVFSIVYALGIVIDRIADAIFAKWNKQLANAIIANATRPISAMRFALGKDNDYLNLQFEYTRSRMRIARASSVNFGLTTLFGTLFILTRLENLNPAERWGYAVFALVAGIVLTGTAVYAWRALMSSYYKLVKTNYTPDVEGQKGK